MSTIYLHLTGIEMTVECRLHSGEIAFFNDKYKISGPAVPKNKQNRTVMNKKRNKDTVDH